MEGARASVLLLSMPFGSVAIPSLALGLLKASLVAKGIPCDLRYFTFPYAKKIGIANYARMVEGYPSTQALSGEWIFSGALFGRNRVAESQYVEQILRGSHPEMASRGPVDTTLIPFLRKARREAAAFIEECYRSVDWARYRVVGFTVMFQQQLASLALAKLVKSRHPDIAILFGGPGCEDVMGHELLKQFPFVDRVVNGEAEEVLPPLVQAIMSGRPGPALPGVLSRAEISGGPAASRLMRTPVPGMDQLPIPDLREFFDQQQAHGLGKGMETILPFETSRGCWWGERAHCTFCGLNGQSMAFRSKSPDRALAELQGLVGTYGKRRIQVVDNILDQSYLETFLPKLRDAKLDLWLFYEVKSNLNKLQLRILKESGIQAIQPGIESLSSEVLKLVKKGVTALQNIRLLKWCQEIGITVFWNILWGIPGEDPACYAEMESLVPALEHLTPPEMANTVRLDRFSPLFSRPEAHGVRSISVVPSYRWIYPFDEQALSNLAYYFSFEADYPKPLRNYTRGLGRRVAAWRSAYDKAALFFLRKDNQVFVADTRRCASEMLSRLGPAHAALLQFCSEGKTREEACRHLSSRFEMRESSAADAVVAQMLDRRFVVPVDGRLLSVVVDFDGPATLRPGAYGKLSRQFGWTAAAEPGEFRRTRSRSTSGAR